MLAKVPVLSLYTEASCRHLADEVLFGEEVAVLYELPRGLVCVRTENDYFGIAKRQELTDETLFGEAYRIVSPAADVLPESTFDAPPLYTLPRFSRVRVQEKTRGFYRIALPERQSGFVFCGHAQKHLPRYSPDAVCDTALSFLGTPYRYGGRSSFGVDCSGLLCLAFGAHGVLLPRDTALMRGLCRKENKDARRGDIVLFQGHVGLLLTAERFVHASAAVGCVSIASLDPADPLFDAAHVAGGYSVRDGGAKGTE